MSAPGPRQTRAAREAARKAKADAMRKAEQARARRRRLITWSSVAALIVAIAVVVVVVAVQPRPAQPATSAAVDTADEIIPAGVSGSTVIEAPATPVANTSGISGVLAWDTDGWPGDGTAHPGALEHQHVTGPVTYSVTPPVGGPHNAVWMNAGVYTKPVPTERAVHNLEHGAVWITYRPSLPASEIATLTEFVGSQSLISEPSDQTAGQANRYVDLSPWSDDTLPAPIVISAWGRQLRVTSPSDPRLQQFVNTFRHNPTYTPEYGAPVDGIPVQTGGVPAAYGSVKPNPPGSATS